MQILRYVLLGFAPGLFWLWFFRRKDDLEPEPRLLVLRVFGLGALSALAALLLRPLLEPLVPPGPGWTPDVVDAFVVTAVPEEALKAAAFLLGAFFHRELDEPLDGIIYGVAAGLGFASVENVLYLLGDGTIEVLVMRSFTATLGHAALTGAVGFGFGVAKFSRGPRRVICMAAGLLFAVGVHGLYDLFLFPDRGALSLLSLLGILPMALLLLGLNVRWSRARSPRYHPAPDGPDKGRAASGETRP